MDLSSIRIPCRVFYTCVFPRAAYQTTISAWASWSSSRCSPTVAVWSHLRLSTFSLWTVSIVRFSERTLARCSDSYERVLSPHILFSFGSSVYRTIFLNILPLGEGQKCIVPSKSCSFERWSIREISTLLTWFFHDFLLFTCELIQKILQDTPQVLCSVTQHLLVQTFSMLPWSKHVWDLYIVGGFERAFVWV